MKYVLVYLWLLYEVLEIHLYFLCCYVHSVFKSGILGLHQFNSKFLPLFLHEFPKRCFARRFSVGGFFFFATDDKSAGERSKMAASAGVEKYFSALKKKMFSLRYLTFKSFLRENFHFPMKKHISHTEESKNHISLIAIRHFFPSCSNDNCPISNRKTIIPTTNFPKFSIRHFLKPTVLL